jgi:isopenicillin N synthase-like dioxygenase
MSGSKLGSVTDCDVQVIDFGAFVDGSKKQEVADSMFTSLRDTGFVYLANHSLPQEKIDAMFEWVRSRSVLGDTWNRILLPIVSPRDFLIYPWKPSSSHLIRPAVNTIEVCSFLRLSLRVPKYTCRVLGFSAPGVEKVTQHVYDDEELARHRAQAPDVKETFECGKEESADMPNIWLPDGNLPGFKEACLEYYWVC